MRYKVLRQHYGDKQYVEGDMREIANEVDAKQLATSGLIELKPEANAKTKSAPKPKNKMEEEPSNKAE